MAKKTDEITQLTQEELDERIIKTEITDEMQSSYLDYAMSVIVSRALPDVRDGLKPVQRRIIYAMQDQNMTASTKFHKCAAVVGEVLKKYHPHGDTSVYEALVRMAQDFNLRYPLVSPQGNFGSIDGDPPAAMRYTECKLQKISEELYSDIDKETIAFVMNDLQNYEPQKEIIQMYATGKGRVVTRATMGVEEGKGDKLKLVVTEIPYMVNKSTLISKIADLVKDKRIEGISDLRDESNKQGIRIVIELKKEAVVKKIQNQLYKYTQLQNTFNANFVALLDNEPKLMTLKMILEEFVRHRQQVVVNRTIFLLKKAREREHILQGLKIALDNLDAVIALIRASKDAEVAKLGLMKKFGLSEIQAQAILDMQLRKLAALERQKIEDELKQIIATIEDYEDLLASPERIIDVVKKELSDLKQRYGDKRKTIVVKGMVGELSDEDLIIDEPCIVTISESGYIKRLKEDTYKKQGRGGKGVVGQGLKEEDSVDTIRTCSTHDWALFFTNTGRVYKMRVWDIPESSRTAKGTPLVNFLSTTQSERIEAFLTVTTADMSGEKGFVFFVTEKGVVKRTGMPEFSNIRSSGILAIKLGEGDNLAFAGITYGEDDVLITTTMGQSIRFSEKDVRDMGRAAGGVTGIKLSKGNDKVVGSVIIPKNAKNIDLLVVSDKGYGKRTKTGEYKTQSRAGSGILTYKVTDKTGHLVSARAVNTGNGSDVLLATSSGKVLRIGAKNVPVLGRATQGVRLIKLDSGDTLTSAAVLDESLEEITE